MIARMDSSFRSFTRGSDAAPTPRSYSELLSLSPEEIERCDMALANMLCAEGLPGAEDLDVSACLNTLDAWTDSVGHFVRESRHSYQRNPSYYDYHKGFFCLLTMVTKLKHPKQKIGIGYNPDQIGKYDFSDSRDDLIHGLLTRRMGTCSSLPVLFMVVGRRLGWPMHLALAKSHVLVQWLDDDGSRRNLEGTCAGGGEMHPDEHFHNWPHKLLSEDLATGRYLRPLTGAESLSMFVENRGHCLFDNQRFSEARKAYAQAMRIAPNFARYELPKHRQQLCEGIGPRKPPFESVDSMSMNYFLIAPPVICLSGTTH